MSDVILIAAIDDKRGIARAGKMPWDIPADRRYFRKQTEGKTIVLGSRTYAEIQPLLRGRKAYVLSRQNETLEGASVIHDLATFLNQASDEVWVVGGGETYKSALPFATKLLLTRVSGDFNCDVFFPAFEDAFYRTAVSDSKQENGYTFQIETWQPKRG